MNPLAPTDPGIYTDLGGLSALRAQAEQGTQRALPDAARQFEAIFIHILLKSMRAAELGEGFMDTETTRFYRDMFDQQLSVELSKDQGIGIAEMLVKQLGGPPAEGEAVPLTQDLRTVRSPLSASRIDWKPGSAREFLAALVPHAREVGKQLGVDPRFIMAQAALETGWGQHQIRHPNGRTSFNVFGIKAGSQWQGSRVEVPTLEFRNGKAFRTQADFRAYGSLGESVKDYGRLLSGSERYRPVLATGGDATAFTQALQDAGYATDPQYAEKIRGILRGETFNNALAKLKMNPPEPLT